MFPLDVTADDVEAMVGAGTYRVYAIGAEGAVLDYVTTVSVGEPVPAEPEPAPSSLGTLRGAGSDLRFALETILQMSRAQSDSLKAVALAPADWVKDWPRRRRCRGTGIRCWHRRPRLACWTNPRTMTGRAGQCAVAVAVARSGDRADAGHPGLRRDLSGRP